MTETKIARYGNSLSIRLPAGLARDMDMHEGDRVTIRRVDHTLLIERTPRSRLEARLATVREPESEVGAGRTMGVEVVE